MSRIVRVEGLKKTFVTPAGVLHVLKGIDTEFQKGEIVGIVGASGAGKSTFLHILGTLDTPSEGSVYYASGDPDTAVQSDIDPFRLDDAGLAGFRNKTVGFVFQFHYLLPEFSALENVMMPGLIGAGTGSRIEKNELIQRAEHLLNELGIYERRNHKPGELSGGEQQRAAVARALILQPKVVLADEPTGNLDTETGEELFRLLMKINSEMGITFIIVTHNQSLSDKCHRVVRMADGRLIDL